MPLFELDGVAPTIHPDAWVAETATIVGDVRLGAGASVWYGAVVRGDVGTITIGEGSNVQDGSVLHLVSGTHLRIGSGSTVAHGCIVHCLEVGDGTLIGNGSTVLDGAVIGSGVLVAAGSLVTPGTQVPDGSLVKGAPAKVVGPIEPGSTAAGILERNARQYVELARHHRATLKRID